MIAAADVKDQELSVRSVGRRVYNPAIARRGHLGPRSGRDRGSLLAAAHSVGSAEFTYPGTADGQGQLAFGGNKGNRGPHSGRISERSQARAGFGRWL